MRKYQEALNRLNNLDNVETDYDDMYTFITGRAFQDDINLLQELIDKHTPKKPLNVIININNKIKVGDCPSCHNLVTEMEEICDEKDCSQVLDWSDQDE